MVRTGIDTRPYIERFDGDVRLKMPPSPYHCVVQPVLAPVIRRCAGERGFVLTELHMSIGAIDGTDTLYLPDIAFVLKDRVRALPAPNAIPDFAPDIAVEIRSPEVSAAERARKIGRYVACGTDLVLDVDPDSKEITAHTAGTTRRFAGSDTFSAPAFPWLRFTLAEIFAERDRWERLTE